MPSDYEKMMKIAAEKADNSYKQLQQPPLRTKTQQQYNEDLIRISNTRKP